jgi:hypothetical protein
MGATIKLSEDAKKTLETLQAKITQATGTKIPQRMLLDTIIRFSADHTDQILQMTHETQPLTQSQIDTIMQDPMDWDAETREEENTKRRLEEATKAAEELGDYLSKTPEKQVLHRIKEDRRTR